MFNMFKKQGTSNRSASTSMIGDREPGFGSATPTDMGSQASAGDMAWACDEEQLDDAQLAAVVGGVSYGEIPNDEREIPSIGGVRGWVIVKTYGYGTVAITSVRPR